MASGKGSSFSTIVRHSSPSCSAYQIPRLPAPRTPTAKVTADVPRARFEEASGSSGNLIDPSLLAAPSVTTGLPNGMAQLACYGAAVPTPDWNRLLTDRGSVPQVCANGASASLADALPTVRLFDPSFTVSKSRRGNLALVVQCIPMAIQSRSHVLPESQPTRKSGTRLQQRPTIPHHGRRTTHLRECDGHCGKHGRRVARRCALEPGLRPGD